VELTERQEAILTSIRESVVQRGYPPTVREIGVAVGLSSPASVQGHLALLEERGLIRRGVAKRRALELVEPENRRNRPPDGGMRRLPLVGQVAAGVPLLADENVEEIVGVPEELTRGQAESFVLRVKGDSMVKAGILDGDMVVVRRQETASNGEIVVALIEDEATLKRFFLEDGYVRLQPENDAMEPILSLHPRIVGRVTGVMRRL
jgi:repressor LexA